jgi:hypothetical protein
MGTKVRTWPEGRRCKSPKCKRRLSIYNRLDYCCVHRDEVLWKEARKTPYYHRA